MTVKSFNEVWVVEERRRFYLRR